MNHSVLRHSSRNLPLKLSFEPFCHGLPGSMRTVLLFSAVSLVRVSCETNSGSLSERRRLDAPCTLTGLDSIQPARRASRALPSRTYSRTLGNGSLFRLPTDAKDQSVSARVEQPPIPCSEHHQMRRSANSCRRTWCLR